MAPKFAMKKFGTTKCATKKCATKKDAVTATAACFQTKNAVKSGPAAVACAPPPARNCPARPP